MYETVKVAIKAARVAAIIAVIVLATSLSAAAEFTELPLVGTRPYGMGGAFVAVANGPESLYWNPAGTAGGRAFGLVAGAGGVSLDNLSEAMRSLEKLQERIADGQVNAHALIAAEVGDFALGTTTYGHLTADSGQLTNETGISWGKKFIDLPGNLADLAVGAGVKQVRISDITQNATTEELEKYYAVDAGAQVSITPLVHVGGTIRQLWNNGDRDPSWQIGVAVTPPIFDIVLAADYDSQGTMHYGMETDLLFNLLTVRAGYMVPKEEDPRITGGVAVNVGPVSIEGAVGSNNGFDEFDASAAVRLRF